MAKEYRYLRGSENAVVLVDNTKGHRLSVELAALMSTKAINYHINRFMGIFELLCKSYARGDQYRCSFYAFILKHSVVTLQMIGAGVTQHLYLPETAYNVVANDDMRLPDLDNAPRHLSKCIGRRSLERHWRCQNSPMKWWILPKLYTPTTTSPNTSSGYHPIKYL